MSLKKRMLFSVLASCVSLSALQEFPLDPYRPLQCSFSSLHHNRVAFDGAGVVQIYSEHDWVDATPDPVSGQIFVRYLGGADQTALLSFVLDTGDVQDVFFDFSSRPSEVLLVRCCCLRDSLDCSEVPVEECFNPRDPEFIRGVIDDFKNGTVPNHCQSVPHTTYQKRLSRGVYLVRVGKFLCQEQVLYLYEVKNTRRRSVSISAQDLRHEGGVWSFVDVEKIPSRSKALGIVAMEKRV